MINRSCPSNGRPETGTEVDANFSVGWTHRLRFTRDAFAPGNHALRDLLALEDIAAHRLLVCIDDGVASAWPALGDDIRTYFDHHAETCTLISAPVIVPGGEIAKNDRSVFDDIVKAIHDAGLCRHSTVLVIGGGAVLDVVGYAAAVSHRGVRLVRMPSTTLAQDDAGIGVKNGINAFGKKNFLGTFAPPWAVLNDELLLTTQSDRDWISGISEAIKVALVKDATLFDDIEAAADDLRDRNLAALCPIVQRSADLHLRHITEGGDPFEMTEARPLDFGHWSAHKLEQMTSYRLRHGEAVAIGIALDTTYSRRLGWLDQTSHARICDVLRRIGLPLFAPEMSRTNALFAGLEEFREHLGGRLTIAMLRGIGDAFDTHEIDTAVMAECIDELRSAAETAAGQ